MAAQETNGIPYFIDHDESGLKTFAGCTHLRGEKRKVCFDNYSKATRARINLHYPSAAQIQVENVYYAKWDEYGPQWVASLSSLNLTADAAEVLARLQFYESISRASHEAERFTQLYRSHVTQINQYNAAVDSYYQNISNSLQHTSQQLQIQNLQGQINRMR